MKKGTANAIPLFCSPIELSAALTKLFDASMIDEIGQRASCGGVAPSRIRTGIRRFVKAALYPVKLQALLFYPTVCVL